MSKLLKAVKEASISVACLLDDIQEVPDNIGFIELCTIYHRPEQDEE